MNTRVESTEYIQEILPKNAAKNFLDVLNGLHHSIHFTMELSNNDSKQNNGSSCKGIVLYASSIGQWM